VEEEDHRALGRSLVEVVHPERATVLIGDLGEIGREVESVEAFEAMVRGPENLHTRVTSTWLGGTGNSQLA
jgi:hypothetical protein